MTRCLRRIAALAAACGLGCGIGGCGAEAPPEVPVPQLRLVEQPREVEPAPCCGPVARADATDPPTAQIGEEGRPVLRAYPEHWIRRIGVLRPRGGDAAQAWLPLPGELHGAERIWLSPEVGFDGRWQPSTPQLAAVRVRSGTLAVPVPVPWPERERHAVWLHAFARVPPAGASERIDTEPLRIPPGATLRFGFGLLPETAPSEVRFRVSACRGQDCQPLDEATLAASPPAWHDREVALANLAGERIAFRFEAAWPAGEVAFPLWSDPTLTVPGPRPPGPSLLLISLDTLRADHLPAYGYPLDTAPFLSDELAPQATLFERAVSSADMTGPSHLTLLTGLQPWVHGLRSNVEPERVPGALATLASVLRAQGFATGAVTEGGALAFGNGVERGFDHYREQRQAKQRGGGIEATLAAGRAWLDAHAGRRSFLFLHSYEPHTPYDVPERYARLGYPGDAERQRWSHIPARWDPRDYDREIRQTDDALREFLGALDREGRLDDTFVVVLSDHGEAFLEHGALHHGGVLEESVLRVPLLVRGPGVAQGRRVPTAVGLVDLLPTLLELLGVEGEAGGMGRSFAAWLREGAAPRAPAAAERPLFSESWSTSRSERREGRIQRVEVEPPALAVRVGDVRLVRDRREGAVRERFFDLSHAPEQEVDLAASDPATAARLRGLLDEYSTTMQAQRDALAGQGAGDAVPLDAERREALRALGYLE